MLRSELYGFGFLVAAGCATLAGCGTDSKAGNTADAGSGGATASGGSVGSGGAGTGGHTTGGAAATGGVTATGGAASGGAASDASTTDGSAGGTTNDASTADSGEGGSPDASSSGGAGSGGTGSGGAGTGGAGGGSPVVTCGAAPYARLWVGGGILLDHPTGEITVTGPASVCSGTTLTLTPTKPSSNPGKTGPDAQFFDVPDKVPVHLRATQTGSFPLLTQETLPDKDSLLAGLLGFSATQSVFMVASDFPVATLDPTWNASTKAVLLLQIAPLQGATGACADTTGITVVVDGHPEARGKDGADPILTIAGTEGTYVFVTTTGTATAAELLTLTLTKTGCTVKTTGYEASPGLQTTLTGKYPVEAGAVTWGLAAISN